MAKVALVRSTDIWSLLASILLVILGFYVWSHPAEGLLAIALYLGIALIVVGVGYFMQGDALVGIIDALVGIIFVANLGLTAASLPIIFGLWCIIVGLSQLYTAYQVKMTYSLWFWPMLSGVLGVIFGILILAYPNFGFLTIPALMGTYLLLFGITGILEYAQGRKLI